jgi:hypothetical protein
MLEPPTRGEAMRDDAQRRAWLLDRIEEEGHLYLKNEGGTGSMRSARAEGLIDAGFEFDFWDYETREQLLGWLQSKQEQTLREAIGDSATES